MARREVRSPGYSIHLCARDREVSVRDPLEALIADFVAELTRVCGGGEPSRPGAIAQRMQMLEALVDAFVQWRC